MDKLNYLINQASASNDVLAVVVAAILSAIGWTIHRAIAPHSKIAWAFSHQHTFWLQNLTPPILAYTKEVWIQNVGSDLAEEIEVIFSFKPQHFDVWPQRRFAEFNSPDGNFGIKFDNLNKREYVTISIFHTAIEPPLVTNVRWRGGVGKEVPMGPQQIFPRCVYIVVRFLLLLGVFSVFYFGFRIFW